MRTSASTAGPPAGGRFKSDQGESLHEATIPDELESGNLAELVDYQLTQGDEHKLVKRAR